MTFARPSPEQLRRQKTARKKRNLRGLLAVRGRPAVVGGSTTAPAPKERVLKSAAYENAVRALGFCVRCGRACRPQFCHADQGKGQGLKTDVREGWAGCGCWGPMDPGCHYIVGTSGTLPKEERRAEEKRLAATTRHEVRVRGLWPKNVAEWTEA